MSRSNEATAIPPRCDANPRVAKGRFRVFQLTATGRLMPVAYSLRSATDQGWCRPEFGQERPVDSAVQIVDNFTRISVKVGVHDFCAPDLGR
jgi:hypothetical protein